jgi:anaerobic magnesium-protoporphyrin IX monomethyl ester cyclase
LLDGDDRKGSLFMSEEFYETTAYPARHLVDMASYHYSIEGHNATSLIAQLGCPFSCGFCGGRNSSSLRIIRTRSAESIVAELEHLYRTYGYTGFMFYDDKLNVNPSLISLMNSISDLQERLGVAFRLRGFIKAELFTDEQAMAMYRAGFRWLLCGFEAAHPRILKNIEKRATCEDNTRAVNIAKKNGLKVKALMSIGHLCEMDETVSAIGDWLIEMDVDEFDCTIITTYPGTPYYDLSVPNSTEPGIWTYTVRSGDRLHSRDVDFSTTSDFYKGIPGGGYQAFVYTDYLSSDELVTLRDSIELEVRTKLAIPFGQSRAALQCEHSMGQGLPDVILRYGRNSAE